MNNVILTEMDKKRLVSIMDIFLNLSPYDADEVNEMHKLYLKLGGTNSNLLDEMERCK